MRRAIGKKLGLSILGVMTATSMLSGCATTPAHYAANYHPKELIDLVMAGQVQPNEYMPVYGSKKQTPFCLLLANLTHTTDGAAAAAALNHLLNKGANVNQPCAPLDGDDILKMNPLDELYSLALLIASQPQPNTSKLATAYAWADKLIQRGARPNDDYGRYWFTSGSGPMTFAYFQNKVSEMAAASQQRDREREDKRLEEARRDKENNANTLRALTTMAGMAVNNYAAAKSVSNAQAASAALPLAKVTTMPPAKAAPVIGAENVKLGKSQPYTSSAAGTQVSDADAAKLGAKMAGISLDKLNTARTTSMPTGSASASPVTEIKANAVKIENADFDALGGGLPKTQPYSFSCGGNPATVEMMPAEAPNNCVAEHKQFMLIQCYPAWMVDHTNISRLRCATEKSRGRYKLEYAHLLKVYQAEVSKTPGCGPNGCTGRDHLRMF